jgi:glycosyltransferase involved in cell wall biosynthesis
MTQNNLPFTDPTVWEYLRGNSYLSEKYKLLYIATPKVACTSLKWWFASLEGYSLALTKVTDSSESDPDLIIHDSFYKIAPTVTGLLPNALAEPLISGSYFRFAVVRNPYKRIFSAWQSKILLREPLQAEPYLKEDFFWLPVNNEADLAHAFERFLEHLAACEAPNYLDFHWTPQATLLRPDLIDYSNLSRIEDIINLKLALAKHLGPDAPEPFTSRRNEGLIPYLPEFITERAAELIKFLYAQDFQIFGYDNQPPEANIEFSESELQVAIQALALIRGRHKRIADIRRSLTKQIADRDGQISNLNEMVQALSARMTEEDQSTQALSAKLVEIENSRMWRLSLLFHQIHLLIAPPNGIRARALHLLKEAVYFPFKKITQNRKAKAELDLIRSSGDFDSAWYLADNPDVAQAKVDPYQHYQNQGRFEGRTAKFEMQKGLVAFEPSRDTILVVSHEASRTGAPILALNIIQNLQKKYNVVTLLLGEGSIVEYFLRASTYIAGPILPKSKPATVACVIEKMMELFEFKFAIVNSIESRPALPVLAKWFVPTISLIHEFSVYTRPRGEFLEAVLWSTEIIFSTSMTQENAVFEHPELKNHPFHIIHQGQCTIPFDENCAAINVVEDARVLRMLRPEGLPADAVVVLGIGSVHIRKGVELFIDCAARVVQSGHGKNFRFIWIGNGYNPEEELGYSAYLGDQIRRSGLQEHVFFLEETPRLSTAYKAANILLISSRLDPMPNIAIDAMAHGLPLVCFEKTTGIADILIAHGLGDKCVASYLDTVEMAAKVMAFAESKPLCQKVGDQLRQVAIEEFDMEKYVKQLEVIGLASRDLIAQEKMEFSEIVESGLARLDFYLLPHSQQSPAEAIRYYVRSWASGIRRRKLFPGFHPGIFMEQHGLSESGGDPLADYLRAGQPSGEWRVEVITSEGTAQILPPEVRIALHLHVYSMGLLPEILKRLNGNRIRPDLFISVPAESVRNQIQSVLLHSYSGKVIEIKVVPERGRDIGPFLTAFGAAFADGYDIVGHLYTEKSTDVQDDRMDNDWHTFLLENLLGGNCHMADIILGHLAADPTIGIIFPDDPNVVGWGKNRSYAEALGQRLGINELPEYFFYPDGTMFWAKVESLLPILNLGLDWQDYPTEPLSDDDSIFLALERLLPLVVSNQGFRLALTNVAGITR